MQMIAFFVICVATMFSLMTWILSTIAIVLRKQQRKSAKDLKQKLKHFIIRDSIYLVVLWSLWWMIG